MQAMGAWSCRVKLDDTFAETGATHLHSALVWLLQ